jgi:AcrR family transcriptional regulator
VEKQAPDQPLSIAAGWASSKRKLDVLNAAIALFAERGFDRVSVRDIGERLGMTGPSIYRHFEGKADILAQAVDLVIRPLNRRLEEIAESDGSPRERLEAAVLFHADFALRHQEYLRVYYAETQSLTSKALKDHRRSSAIHRDLWIALILDAGAARDPQESMVVYSMLMGALNVGAWTNARLSHGLRLELVYDRAMALLLEPADGTSRRGQRAHKPPLERLLSPGRHRPG